MLRVSSKKIQELRTLAKSASPLPWFGDGMDTQDDNDTCIFTPPGKENGERPDDIEVDRAVNNAKFAGMAASLILPMADELEMLRKKVTELSTDKKLGIQRSPRKKEAHDPDVANSWLRTNGKDFVCPKCGCAVFHQHDRDVDVFHCNSCHYVVEGIGA